MTSLSMYFVDGLPSLGLGKNKGRKTALGYTTAKGRVMSLPAHLNGGKMPTLREAGQIYRGVSVAQSVGVARLIMNKVVARARFSEMQDVTGVEVDAGLPVTPIANFWQIRGDAYSDVKAVHAMEDVIYEMRMDAEKQSGTYAEYKAAYVAPVAAPIVNMITVQDEFIAAMCAANGSPKFQSLVIAAAFAARAKLIAMRIPYDAARAAIYDAADIAYLNIQTATKGK